MLLTQGFSQPLSVLGLDIWTYMIDQLKMNTMTPQINGSAPAIYGKEYLSITAFKKIFGKRQTSTFIGSFDTNLKKIFKDINLDEHAFIGEVEGTKNYKKVILKSIIKVLPSALKGLFGDYKKEIDKYKETSREIIEATKKLKDNGDFSSISKSGFTLMSKSINSVPIIMSSFLAKNSISKIFAGNKLEKEISALNMNLEGNPTSQMNYILFLMASHKDFQEVSSKDEFIEKLKKRDFSKAFLNLFDQFMEKYSCRVFKEIDVASKRIYEDLGLLYNKLLKYAKSKGKGKKFIKSANKLKATFGYREHPKYLLIFIISKLHDICLEIVNQWVEEGRLEEAYHIFDLKADQISQGQKDPYFDLNKARLENLSGYLDTNLWPLVIDSRGKIYIPKLEIKNGDFIGQAIAPGKVIGPAKILKTPYEKILNPGEILVVKATEPSWTPIFTNASGIIMEIGGPLQHGGIIAREYGIPCVSDLMGFMDKIKDGDILEVDGSSGLVKILDTK
ncbi:MAG: PEP-utilizing enzyme [Peptoniphilaceae bacterium]